MITTKDLLPLWMTIVCSFALGVAAVLVGEWLADCAKTGCRMRRLPLPAVICAWCKQPIDFSKRYPRYVELVRQRLKKGSKRFFCCTHCAGRHAAWALRRGAA